MTDAPDLDDAVFTTGGDGRTSLTYRDWQGAVVTVDGDEVAARARMTVPDLVALAPLKQRGIAGRVSLLPLPELNTDALAYAVQHVVVDPELLARLRAYRAVNPTWGVFHVTLEDQNLGDSLPSDRAAAARDPETLWLWERLTELPELALAWVSLHVVDPATQDPWTATVRAWESNTTPV